MFCAHGTDLGVIEGVGSHFLFCAPELIFDGTVCAGYRFHVLRSYNRF
jgi:hypothetical protein